ncbi:hypothetical protein WN943_010632 [Citrus x changshan-huyou]
MGTTTAGLSLKTVIAIVPSDAEHSDPYAAHSGSRSYKAIVSCISYG